jgi:two-component system response regulator
MCIRILLVSSDPGDVESVRSVFADQRVHAFLEAAASGEEALDILFARGEQAGRGPGEMPQLVLLDIRLPGSDGFEVLARIRAHERTRRIPVVLMSDARDLDQIARGYELGANSFIVKPLVRNGATPGTFGRYWAHHNVPPDE